MALSRTPKARQWRSPLRRFALFTPLTLTLIFILLPSSAAAGRQLSDEEREGQRVVAAVRDGDRDCRDLSREDFVAAGDYAMGQSFASARAHEAMDELMREMMGERAEEQTHDYLGRQETGCGGGQIPAGFAGMMGTMGGFAGSGSVMGGWRADGGGFGPGAMMGAGFVGRSAANGDDDWGGGAVVMVALMALLVAIAAVAVWRWPLRRAGAAAGETPLDVLSRRFARGEIDADEYRQRRDALGGAT